MEVECSLEPDLIQVAGMGSEPGVLETVLEAQVSSKVFQRGLETGYQAWERKKLYPGRAPTRHQEISRCWRLGSALEIEALSELKGGMAYVIQHYSLA